MLVGWPHSDILGSTVEARQIGSGDPNVSQTSSPPRIEKRSPEEIRAELRRLREEIRARNPDMTGADWDALADRLGAELRARLGDRVRASRGARLPSRTVVRHVEDRNLVHGNKTVVFA